jgi:acetate kinase
MKILVVNCGSSSIKYKLYEFPKAVLIKKGLIEKIGEQNSPILDHSQGIKELFSHLIKEKIVKDVKEISAIGHRVVHGGETFKKPHIIDQEVIEKIKECVQLAPLHNPANLAGIIGCREVLPNIPQVAVFDTAFHQTIPEYVYLYAMPYRYYKEYGIRRYGFHGTSHQFVAQSTAKLLKKSLNKLKLITCHLGNGCSITAINKGRVLDTSMGFTPLEGLIMGTRCGDVDVAAVFHIMEREKLTPEQMDVILNKKSGLLGVSGISNDIRAIKEKARKKDHLARLSLEMFLHRIKKYIGAYYLILGGADAICFTAGIGENNPDMINRLKKDISKIVPKKTKILVVPTDEEKMIAHLTQDLIKNLTYGLTKS